MKKVFGIFFLLALSISCASDIAIDQINDFKVRPIFVANLASFDFKATQFVNSSGAQISSVSDEMPFDLLSFGDATKNLNRADFQFEVTNTIKKAYTISLKFLDDKNVLLRSIDVLVPAYSGSGIAILVLQPEKYENTELDLLRKTRKVKFELLMSPVGATLTNNSLGTIKMRSSVNVYFLLQ